MPAAFHIDITPWRKATASLTARQYHVFLVLVEQRFLVDGLVEPLHPDVLSATGLGRRPLINTIRQLVELKLVRWQDHMLAVPTPFARLWQRAPLSKKQRQAILQRDGFRCVYCGSAQRLEVDHVHPVSRGGTNDPDNLVAACFPCNRSKRHWTLSEWLS